MFLYDVTSCITGLIHVVLSSLILHREYKILDVTSYTHTFIHMHTYILPRNVPSAADVVHCNSNGRILRYDVVSVPTSSQENGCN
jgi:hypothetical protein